MGIELTLYCNQVWGGGGHKAVFSHNGQKPWTDKEKKPEVRSTVILTSCLRPLSKHRKRGVQVENITAHGPARVRWAGRQERTELPWEAAPEICIMISLNLTAQKAWQRPVAVRRGWMDIAQLYSVEDIRAPPRVARPCQTPRRVTKTLKGQALGMCLL